MNIRVEISVRAVNICVKIWVRAVNVRVEISVRAVNIRVEISGRKVREMDIQGQAASATHQQPEVNYLPRFSPQLI